MNRRDFIRSLALLTAGASALPEQINAIERIISTNTPAGLESGLIAIRDVLVYGTCMETHPASFGFGRVGGKSPLTFGLNLKGGVFRYTPPAEFALIGKPEDLCFEAKSFRRGDGWLQPETEFGGSIVVMEQSGEWQNLRITRAAGTLADLYPGQALSS